MMKSQFNKSYSVRKAKPIKPHKRVDDLGRELTPLSRQVASLIKQLTSNVGKVVNIGVLLVIIVFLSLLIGSYAFPISQLNTFTLPAILDAITKNPFPQTRLILSTLFASLVALYIYLPKELPASNGDHNTARRFTRLIAGFIFVVLFNSWFFGIDFLTLSRIGENIILILAEPLTAQGIAFVVIFIALLLFRESVSFDRINTKDFPPILISLWNWGRFLFISFGLVIFAGWFTTWFVLPYLGGYLVVRSPVTFFPIEEISLPLMTAIAISMTVAAVIFAPPEHRCIDKSLITWRLMLIIASVGTILWAYRLFSLTDHFFLIVVTAFGLSVALVFLQRALS